jgi:prevent-host-death family protein
MRTIKASEFKAKCLALMDEVASSGESLLVTKNGKPVAELRPHRPATSALLGILKGKVKITGDIISPIDDVEWEAMK